MKVLEKTINWDALIDIQMTLKDFKLLRDCLILTPYARLEKLEENHEMPYSYDDMQETIKQTDEILEKLMMRK